METQVVAPFSGKVRQIMTIPNVQVDIGAPLIQIEPSAEEITTGSLPRVTFSTSLTPGATKRQSSWRQNLDELRQLMLGFDVNPAHTARVFGQWSRFQEASGETTRFAVRKTRFSTSSWISARCSVVNRPPTRHPAGKDPARKRISSPTCAVIQTQGEGLPADICRCSATGSCALRYLHAGSLDSIGRYPAVDLQVASATRIDRSRPFSGCSNTVCLVRGDASPDADESFRTLLDRLIATTRGSSPTVSDVAREVRYRCFEQARCLRKNAASWSMRRQNIT